MDNADGTLMPQMTAQVSFVSATAEGVLRVPLAALDAVPGERGRYRARVLDGSKAQPREVRVGVRNRLDGEVLDGLAEGETLVLGELDKDDLPRRFQW
ncbi:Macrolide export protein MacA [compost metagenome]